LSVGVRIPWKQAVQVAAALSENLLPVVERSKVVGSVRRRRPTVGDIEFLVEPRRVPADLFGATKPDTEAIRAVAETWGRIVKAGDRMIQITDLRGIKGWTCDLYLVHPPANWWALLCNRTGPAELGHLAVTLMQHRGYYQRQGRVVDRAGRDVPIESEEGWLRCAGLPCLPPHLRDDRAALLPLNEEGER
jgi:DNA polymerase/3'-5' exonuclease PolX